jgi:beta-mannosidase
VEQQAAMFGVDPALGRGELFGELLPAIVADAGVDAAWVPSAPSGGALPFRFDAGVANYFGVGGYRRPLSDVRVAAVRFASECLAISNVPDEAGVERAGGPGALGERWKQGVPRDAGTDWDFEDVRDHYLALLYDVDPAEMRVSDPARYLELSRAVSGELMAEVFGEWRRAGSPCGGGLVLWLRDLLPGAGWGVLDDRGAPKAVYHHLARALAPVCVWTTDEGLAGVAVHVANDRPVPLRALLRVHLYAGFERRVGEAQAELALDAHSQRTFDVEGLLGRFVDASWAYRFGPPAQDVIVATLESREAAAGILSQAFRFPSARPQPRDADALGLTARVQGADTQEPRLTLASDVLAWGVRVHASGFEALDDSVSVEPGGRRGLRLRPLSARSRWSGGRVTALNLEGSVEIEGGA